MLNTEKFRHALELEPLCTNSLNEKFRRALELADAKYFGVPPRVGTWNPQLLALARACPFTHTVL